MVNREVYERVVSAARAQEFVHYSELAKMLGLDLDNPYFGAQVGKVLGQISEDEVAEGRPMLSAIVVSKDSMLPGHGFYNLGRQLRQTRESEDEIEFAVRQIRRVHEYWRNADQAGFWTEAWQEGERAADDDIASGRTTHADSGRDFLESLD